MELPPENPAAEVVDPAPPPPANRPLQASAPDAVQNRVETQDPPALRAAVDAEDEPAAAPREADSTGESLWREREHVPATTRSSSLDWDAAGPSQRLNPAEVGGNMPQTPPRRCIFLRANSSPGRACSLLSDFTVPRPRRFTPSAPGFLRTASCSDCPPPLVRSVETGECELPVSRVSESDAAPAESALSFAPVLTRSDSATSRPKFKVNCEPTDDGDLLTAIAELACRLEEGADLTETSDTEAMTSDDEAKVGPRGPESEHSDDDGSSSRNSETGLEGRTVTAAEAETMSRTLSFRADAEDSRKDTDPGRKGGRIVSLEEAVRLTGQGCFHVRLLLVSGCLVMAGVLETVVVGYLLPSATLELGMSDQDKGLLAAASYAGIVLSSHTWGLVADTQGRKRALLWATLLDVVASLLSSIAPNFEVLLGLRFCCGLFTSAPAALTFAYLGEFHTPATRSRSIIWIGAFPSVGLILLPGVAWAVLPQCWGWDLGFVRFSPWRLLLVLCALLSLMSALLLWLLVPESPKFLAGREPERAMAVLRRMYALNKGMSGDLYPVDGLIGSPGTKPTVSTVELGDSKPTATTSSLGLGGTLRLIWAQTAPLFKPPFLLHSTLVCLIQFGNLASANGLQIWLPDIFNKLAQFEKEYPNRTPTICAAQDAIGRGGQAPDPAHPFCAPVNEAMFRNNLIIGAVSLAMPLLCGLIVNKVGKRNLLVVCLVVSGTFGVGLSFADSSALVLGLSSVSVAINSMGIGHISSIVVELFPTHLRAMAVSLHLMAGRTGSIAGNLIFGALLSTNCAFAFYAIGGALLTCAVLSCLLPARGKYAA